jgi:hypothetical protein
MSKLLQAIGAELGQPGCETNPFLPYLVCSDYGMPEAECADYTSACNKAVEFAQVHQVTYRVWFVADNGKVWCLRWFFPRIERPRVRYLERGEWNGFAYNWHEPSLREEIGYE